ncbi:hypothetical protein J7K07_05300 [Candidatus Bathyarchaeota archaeon]|nr:hypothetical protein [Candidatus Bathyarchaeota archaeon]
MAKLLLSIVPKITSNSGLVTNADPTIIPRSINVESNRVLTKNLRRMGPTSALFSQSFK